MPLAPAFPLWLHMLPFQPFLPIDAPPLHGYQNFSRHSDTLIYWKVQWNEGFCRLGSSALFLLRAKFSVRVFFMTGLKERSKTYYTAVKLLESLGRLAVSLLLPTICIDRRTFLVRIHWENSGPVVATHRRAEKEDCWGSSPCRRSIRLVGQLDCLSSISHD